MTSTIAAPMKQPRPLIFDLMARNLAIIMLVLGSCHVKAQLPWMDWVRLIGEYQEDRYDAVEVDSHHNVYAAGFHQQPTDLDPGPGIFMANQGGMFIQKFDSFGNLLWAFPISANPHGNSRIYDLAVDGSGNLLATGKFSQFTDFDPGPDTLYLVAPGQSNIFLLKISPTGTLIYAKIAGQSASVGNVPYAIGCDSLNNIVIAGTFTAVLDYNPGPAAWYIYANYIDAFIIKFDSNANPLWAFPLGGSDRDAVNGMHVAPNGTITVVGEFTRTADFDPGIGTTAHTPLGDYEGFFAQYTPAGDFNWVKIFRCTQLQNQVWPKSIAQDDTGNFLVAGSFSGGMDLNPGSANQVVLSVGGEDFFMVKTDAAGNQLWGHRIGASGVQRIHSAGFDALGEVYLTGNMDGYVDFNPSFSNAYLNAAGSGFQVFVAKYNALGHYQWAGLLGGVGTEIPNQTAFVAPDQLYIAGMYDQPCDFAIGPPVVSYPWVHSQDGFLLRMVPCQVTSAMLTDTACSPVTINGQTFSASGIYTQSLQSAAGCDSILTLDLTFLPLQPAVTVSAADLVATPAGAAYQWLDCNAAMVPIPGATGNSFTPTATGSYSVVVDLGYCLDTSACAAYVLVNTSSPPSLLGLSLAPNPGSQMTRLTVQGQPHDEVQSQLTNVTGKQIASYRGTSDAQGSYTLTLDMAELPSGIYFLHVQQGALQAVRMWIKQ